MRGIYTNHDHCSLCRRRHGLTPEPFLLRRIQRKTENQAEKSEGWSLLKLLSCRYIPPDKWPHHSWVISYLRSSSWGSSHLSNPPEADPWVFSLFPMWKSVQWDLMSTSKLRKKLSNGGNVLFLWHRFRILSKVEWCKIEVWRGCLHSD